MNKLLLLLVTILLSCSVFGATVMDVADYPTAENISETYVPYKDSFNNTDLAGKNLTNVNIFEAITGWFTNLFADKIEATNTTSEYIYLNGTDINETGHVGTVCQDNYIWKFDANGKVECRPDSTGSTPNLQQVTDVGSVTDNKVNIVNDLNVTGNVLVGNPAISARIATSSDGTLGVLGNIAWDEAAFLLNDVFGYKLGFDGNQMVTDADVFNIQNDHLTGGFRVMTGQDASNYAMTITHDNKVSVNKNTPFYQFEVGGNARFDEEVTINPDYNTGANQLYVRGRQFPVFTAESKTNTGTGASSAFKLFRNNNDGVGANGGGTGYIYTLLDSAGQESNVVGLYAYSIDATDGIETGGFRMGMGKANSVAYAPQLFSGDGLVLQSGSDTALNWANRANNNEILTILEDDRNMCFGASRDACMGYDSSSGNFLMDPKNVGDGEVEIVGDLNVGTGNVGNWSIQNLGGSYWQRLFIGDTINLDSVAFANQYRAGSGDFYDTFNSTGNGDFETLRDIKSGGKLFVNSDPSDILSIGTGGTAQAVIKGDFDGVTGMQMTNVNNGTNADFRFLIKDTTGHYFTFSQPTVGNTISPIFGLQRNTTDFIFNAGGTARDMGIGTATGQGKFVLASGGVNAIDIDNSNQDLTLSSLAGTYTGGSAFVCVNNAGTIYASEVACP